MMVDSGAEIYPLESALGVYRAPPAAQEAYQRVTIISEVKGEKNSPLGDQTRQYFSQTFRQFVSPQATLA
jgi:hypothetical protein